MENIERTTQDYEGPDMRSHCEVILKTPLDAEDMYVEGAGPRVDVDVDEDAPARNARDEALVDALFVVAALFQGAVAADDQAQVLKAGTLLEIIICKHSAEPRAAQSFGYSRRSVTAIAGAHSVYLYNWYTWRG